MRIRNIKHKGLRRFVKDDDPTGLPPDFVEKIRNIISYLQEMDEPEELRAIPAWRAHQFSGNRQGVWSLTVTRNWRLTFLVDEDEGEIVDLDYEDYHQGVLAMVRLAQPSHPGQFIRMEILEPLGLSVTDAAKALGVTRPTLSALLNQRSALSPEMALRLEKAFGVKMDTLLRMQTAFEIAQARKREGEITVARYVGPGPGEGNPPGLIAG